MKTILGLIAPLLVSTVCVSGEREIENIHSRDRIPGSFLVVLKQDNPACQNIKEIGRQLTKEAKGSFVSVFERPIFGFTVTHVSDEDARTIFFRHPCVERVSADIALRPD